MPQFSFEIVRAERPPLMVRTVDLEDVVAAWREVESLALMLRGYAGAAIRVKNAEGAIVILAGVATAIATADKWRRTSCAPIQRRLKTNIWSRQLSAAAPDRRQR